MSTIESPIIEIESEIIHKQLKQDDYIIHYYVSGNSEGDLIFFLHPAFGDHRCFDKQIDFFSKEYRVITLDLLGHGLSQPGKTKDKIDISVRHLQTIMEYEGYTKAHFAGVSMGSLIGQYFALMFLEKVSSLTILGGYNINADNRVVKKAQRAEGIKWMIKALFSMKAFRRYVASVTVINKAEQERFYWSTGYFKRRSFKVMSGLGEIIQIRNHVKRNHPLLVMSGDHDLEILKKIAENWKKEDPDIVYRIIENAGHCANMDNGIAFNEALMEFLHSQQNN